MKSDRPLLYLDVDGVIAVPEEPVGSAGVYRAHEVHPWPLSAPVRVWIWREWSQWAARLHEAFEIIWATTWRQEANRVMSPILGLPDDLPLLPFDAWNSGDGLFGKTSCVAVHSAGRPFVWIDDGAGDADRQWLADNPSVGEHLVITPDPLCGLSRADGEVVMEWVAEH